MAKAEKILWAIVAVLIASHWLPNLFTKGMFLDGVINALVAENLSQGIGSFFHLAGFDCVDNRYNGHPPLAFQLQAYFFQWFGNGFYTEKIYSFITAIIQLLLIGRIWRMTSTENRHTTAALPILFFLIIPIVSWSYSSNLLENTMSLFTTLAVLAIIRYQNLSTSFVVSVLLYSGCLLAALLCKGPVGLFILAAPFLFIQSKLKSFYFTLAMMLTLVTTLAVFYLFFPGFNEMVANYFKEQIVHTFSLEHKHFWSYMRIWGELFFQISPLVVLWLFLYFTLSNKTKKKHPFALPFLMLGLCGSLPLAISFKQSAFYLLPSMPFFAIGFAHLAESSWTRLLEKISKFWSQLVVYFSIGVVLFFCWLSIAKFGEVLRDKDLIEDAESIAKISKTNCVAAGSDVMNEWQFRAYLYRYHKTALSTDEKIMPAQLIVRKRDSNYSSIDSLLYLGNQFVLYRQIEEVK